MDDRNPTRRDFTKTTLGLLLSVSFLETVFTGCSGPDEGKISDTNGVIEPKAAKILSHWSVQLDEISKDLRTSKISQELWQEQVERLFARIEISELLTFIDFEKLTKRFEYPDLGVNTKSISFPQIKGLDKTTVFHKKIFGMKKGRAIIPHGHSNMASAHLVLDGSFRLRQFEKLREEEDYLIVRPTIDKEIAAGASSSISDERDNVHWFVATSEKAFTFDVVMLDLNDHKYDIHNLDIEASERLNDGQVRAKKMDVAAALGKYGKTHHQA